MRSSGREQFGLSLKPARSMFNGKIVVFAKHFVSGFPGFFNQLGIFFKIAEAKHRHA